MATFRWWAEVPTEERALAWMRARPERSDQCQAAVLKEGWDLYARCTSHRGRALFGTDTRLCRRHRQALAEADGEGK